MSELARAGGRGAAKRGARGWVSHLARLAAVGLGLALGALQQRRRERLAARRVAARERGGGGRGRGGGARLLGHRSLRPSRSLAVATAARLSIIGRNPQALRVAPSREKMARRAAARAGRVEGLAPAGAVVLGLVAPPVPLGMRRPSCPARKACE